MTTAQLQVLGVVVALVTIISGLGGLRLLREQSQREIRKEHEEDKAAAVKAEQETSAREINRIRDMYIEMKNDRDYWRSRAAQFESRSIGRQNEGE